MEKNRTDPYESSLELYFVVSAAVISASFRRGTVEEDFNEKTMTVDDETGMPCSRYIYSDNHLSAPTQTCGGGVWRGQ